MSTTDFAESVSAPRSTALSHLQKANAVRSVRATFKGELSNPTTKDALNLLADTIERNPPFIQSARVYDLLIACYRVGDAKARRLLKKAEVSERRRVSELTVRQVSLLLPVLREYEAKPRHDND